jgi:sugar transferase (PEP-CTERM/EpsH1 system associated)
MNILIVSANIPSPTWGASSRNYYLLKALAKNHKVSLLALSERSEKNMLSDLSHLEHLTYSTQVVTIRSRPKRWRQFIDLLSGKSYVLNAHTFVEMQDAINELFAREAFDLVLFESVLIANYRLPRKVKMVIDQHNIEYELQMRTFEQETAWLRKGYSWLESSRLKPIELNICRQADLVLVTSQRERMNLSALLLGTSIEVVSNGVDIEKFKDEGEEVPNRVIFTGTMDYYPNIHAVLLFAQRCWPLIQAQVPNATWLIAGRNPPAEIRNLAELPGITVTGTVSDVRPYLASSTVAIAPLQIGSGTRLKILEALAMRKAVVTTSVGCEGLTVENKKHLLITDPSEEFARAVVTLLNNPELRTTLGNAGRALIEAEYSWEYSGSRLLQVLETHFEERKSYASATGI